MSDAAVTHRGSGSLRFGIALDLGSRLRDLQQHIDYLMPVIELAESLGFDSIWVGENYARGQGARTDFHTSSSLLVLAALSPRTGMRLGSGVTLLLARDPLNLAYDTAVLDQVTGGRLVVGVGLGQPFMVGRFRQNRLDGPRIDEELAALKALWSGADGYEGESLRIEGGIHPLPLQAGGPQLLVGGGVPASARRAARLADGWYASSAYSRARIASLATAYSDALEDTNGIVAINRLTVLSRDREVGRALGVTHAGRIINAYDAVGALDDSGRASPPGTIGLDAALGATSIIGGAEDAIAALADFARIGVTDVQFRVSPQDTPREVSLETIRVLSEEVLPHFHARSGPATAKEIP